MPSAQLAEAEAPALPDDDELAEIIREAFDDMFEGEHLTHRGWLHIARKVRAALHAPAASRPVEA